MASSRNLSPSAATQLITAAHGTVQLADQLAAEPQLNQAAQLPKASAELLMFQPTAGQKPRLRFSTAAQEPVQLFPHPAAEPQLNQATQEPAQLPQASAELLVFQPTSAREKEAAAPAGAAAQEKEAAAPAGAAAQEEEAAAPAGAAAQEEEATAPAGAV